MTSPPLAEVRHEGQNQSLDLNARTLRMAGGPPRPGQDSQDLSGYSDILSDGDDDGSDHSKDSSATDYNAPETEVARDPDEMEGGGSEPVSEPEPQRRRADTDDNDNGTMVGVVVHTMDDASGPEREPMRLISVERLIVHVDGGDPPAARQNDDDDMDVDEDGANGDATTAVPGDLSDADVEGGANGDAAPAVVPRGGRVRLGAQASVCHVNLFAQNVRSEAKLFKFELNLIIISNCHGLRLAASWSAHNPHATQIGPNMIQMTILMLTSFGFRTGAGTTKDHI